MNTFSPVVATVQRALADAHRAAASPGGARAAKLAALSLLLLAAAAALRHVSGPRQPPCVAVQAATWGLGSSLVHLFHGVDAFGKDNFYWNASTSPYVCPSVASHPPGPDDWSALFAGPSPRALPRASRPATAPAWQVQPPQRAPPSQRLLPWPPPPAGSGGATSGGRASLPPRACRDWTFEQLAAFNKLRRRRRALRFGACVRLCSAVTDVWVLSPRLRDAAERETHRLGRMARPLVALHVRGGDKIKVGNGHVIPHDMGEVRAYSFQPALHALRSAGFVGGTCVIVGDDAVMGVEAGRAAADILNCTVVSRQEPGYAHVQRDFNSDGSDARCSRTKKLLVDTEVIASADAAAGLAQSNVMRVAALLRRCRAGRPLGPEVVDWLGWSVDRTACVAS